MKKTPIVGDRVKIRGYCTLGKDIDGQKGMVSQIRDNDVVLVTLLTANHCVKISQCIKLLKPQPRYYWIGKVRHSDGKHLWKPLVAHETLPEGKDCEGASFRKVKVIRS